jgi:hypothetical protein
MAPAMATTNPVMLSGTICRTSGSALYGMASLPRPSHPTLARDIWTVRPAAA